MISGVTLRDYQRRSVEELRAAFARGARSVCFCLPTGGGKTPVLAHIIALAIQRKQRVLFIAGMVELLNQALAKLEAAGVTNVRVIQADRIEGPEDALVVVASIQTLVTPRWLAAPIPADFLILDECHHGAARTWSQFLSLYPNAKVLGATATTQRGDGKALSMFDTLVVGATVRELIDQGYLVQPRVFAPAQVQGPRELAMDPVAAYLKYAPGQRAIVFCETVAHAKATSESFDAQGIPSRFVSGVSRDRDEVMLAFSRGEFPVLTNVNLVIEGVDVPDVSAGIFARKFTHVGPFLQACGRFLRPSPGKTTATIADLKGSALVHGTPDLDRTFSLDGKGISRNDRTPLRQCPACGGVYVAGSRSACVYCEHELPKLDRALPDGNGTSLNEIDKSHKPQRAWYVPMQAKFAGVCACCSLRFPPGAKIVWAKGEKPKHYDCAVTRHLKAAS